MNYTLSIFVSGDDPFETYISHEKNAARPDSCDKLTGHNSNDDVFINAQFV